MQMVYYDLEYKGRAERVKISDDGNYYVLGTLKEGLYQQALQLEAKITQQIDWHAVPYGLLQKQARAQTRLQERCLFRQEELESLQLTISHIVITQ